MAKDLLRVLQEVRGTGEPGAPYTDGIYWDITIADHAGYPGIYGHMLVMASTAEKVVNHIDDIEIVADNITDVLVVSSINGDVTTTAGIASDVTAVALNNPNISVVAANILNVNKVATIDTDVTAVATNEVNVNIVSSNIGNVNNVGNDITNVNDVAVTVVPNINEILAAPTHAQTATTKAAEANTSATNAATSATESATSATASDSSKDFANKWASEAEDVLVDDGVNPPDYSALHYKNKAAEIAGTEWGVITGNINDQDDLVDRLNLKANKNDAALTGSPTAPTPATSDNSTAIATTEYVTAHKSDTGNPHGVTKAQVGLGNTENTSDADKPVSTATQTALDLKADKTSISNINNTSDMDKPVSTAQQTALNLKANKAQTSATETTYADTTNGLDYKMYMENGKLIMEEI